jgi:hypothetical protein
MNHRMGQRIALDRAISLYVADHGWIDGKLLNISLTGAAIRCHDWEVMEPSMPVEVMLEPGDGMQPDRVKLHGFVVRLENDLVGMMFMRDIVELVQRLRPDTSSSGKPGDQAPSASFSYH